MVGTAAGRHARRYGGEPGEGPNSGLPRPAPLDWTSVPGPILNAMGQWKRSVAESPARDASGLKLAEFADPDGNPLYLAEQAWR